MTHKEVQETAKIAMDTLKKEIKPGMTEIELAEIVKQSLEGQGIKRYWYHGIPALVFAGERTILSQAACEYAPTDYQIKKNDIITVDTAPEEDLLWGDYARTIIIQDGEVVPDDQIKDPEFREGVETEIRLHEFMMEHARPDMKFCQLHKLVDEYLHKLGYQNLDFLSNFGHSVVDGVDSATFYELRNDPRVFFDAKCECTLEEAGKFTFEPHIAKPGGKFGYKREDIFYFVNGSIQIL